MSTIMAQDTIDSEHAVLGAILVEPDLLLAAMDAIDGESFGDARHRTIWNAALDLYQDGASVDPVAIYGLLRERRDDTVRASYLAELQHDALASETSVRYHAGRIADASARRRAAKRMHEILAGLDEAPPLGDLAASLESLALDVGDSIRNKRGADMPSLIAEIRRERVKAREAGGVLGIPTPWAHLRSFLPALSPGHLWVIGGYTSTGKSTWAASLLAHVLNARTAVFSVEDSSQEKARKVVSALTGLSPRALKSGQLSDWQEKAALDAESRLLAAPLLIHDDCYAIESIRLHARKAALRLGGLDLLVVDFVQNLQGAGSLYERMSHAAISLQKLAKDARCCVVALSQVSNEAMRQDADLIGLKGAGELAAAADAILWISRDKKDPKRVKLEVKKNRQWGPTGEIECAFDRTWTQIVEVYGGND